MSVTHNSVETGMLKWNTHAVAQKEETLTARVPERNAKETFSTPIVPQRELFGDSLLETTRGQRKKRMSATVLSIFLQCSFVGMLILIPLLFTDALPQQQLVTYLVAAPPPPPPPPPAAASTPERAVKKVVTDVSATGKLRMPTAIPSKIAMIKEDTTPSPDAGGVAGGVPGGVPGGQIGGVLGGIIAATANAAAVPNISSSVSTRPRVVRLSRGVSEGLLLQQTLPTYPPIARAARIQGLVVLRAVISRDGTIQNLQAISGHPMLVPAAIAAVQQWHYRPYLLNGEPVDVETEISVTFNLSQAL